MKSRSLAVAALLVAAAAPTVAYAAPGPRADVVVPHDYGVAATPLAAFPGDAYGVVLGEPNGTQVFQPVGGGAALPVIGYATSLVGSQLASESGGSAGGSFLTDVATGSTSPRITATLITGTGDGWLELTPAKHIVLHRGSGTADLGAPPHATDLIPGVDPNGALFTWGDGKDQGLEYVDFASATWTVVTDHPYVFDSGVGQVGALTPTSVVWFDDATSSLESAPRGKTVLAPTATQTLQGRPTHLVANGEALAWDEAPVVARGCDAFFPITSETSFGAAPGVFPADFAGCGTVLVAYASGFATNRGNTVSDAGLYAFAPGGTTGTLVVPGTPTAPVAVDATEGHLGVVGVNGTGNFGPSQYESTYRDVLTTDAGSPRPGAVTSSPVAPLDYGPPVFADSGDRRATLAPGPGSTCAATVTRGTSVLTRFAAPFSSCREVTLSGNLLAVAGSAGGVFSTVVENTDTGTEVTEVDGTGVVAGERIAWIDAAGGVRVRDLRTGAQSLVDTLTTTDLSTNVVALQLHGDWLAYADTGQPVRTFHLAPDATAAPGPVLPPATFSLADGLIAWEDGTALHLRDLTGQGDSVVTDDAVGSFALTDTFLAYADQSDHQAHVAQVTEHADAGPRIAGLLPAVTVLQAGETFAPTFEASRDIAGYEFQVTDAAGDEIANVSAFEDPADPRDGSMDLALWDGTVNGKPAPPGTYTWTLGGTSGTDDGRPLTDALGQSTRLTGTIIVPAPGAATATVPAVAEAAVVPVAWGSPAGTTYDVAVSTGIVSSRGRVSWGLPVPWLTGTAETAATYAGSFTPGSELRFVVTPHANGATGPSATAVTEVPIDDSAKALRFSRGWAIGSAHVARKTGLTMTWQTGSSTIRLLGSGPGSAQVFVDGKLVAHLWNQGGQGRVSVGRGGHTVVVRTTGTKPFALDAVTQEF